MIKRCFFYWGNERMSFMRFMTLKSFRIFHHDWEIVLITREKHNHTMLSEKNLEKQDIGFTGTDYTKLALELVDSVRTLEKDYSHISEMCLPEQQNSDMLAWYLVSFEGGVVSDMDILYFKNMDEALANLDNSLPMFSGRPMAGYIPVSFMVGNSKNIFEPVYDWCLNNINKEKYEQFGTNAFMHVYSSLEQAGVTRMPSKLVFPFCEDPKVANLAATMFTFLSKIPDISCAMHWYAGCPEAHHWNEILTHTNFHTYNSTFCNLLRIIHGKQ